MTVKRVAPIVVIALLAMGIGGAAGAQEIADTRLNVVAAAGTEGTLVVEQDESIQQNELELFGAVIRLILAYAGVGLGEGVMNAAIALGAPAFGFWQIGKNIWDAACAIGQEAEGDIGGQPTFQFLCSLYPRWPF